MHYSRGQLNSVCLSHTPIIKTPLGNTYGSSAGGMSIVKDTVYGRNDYVITKAITLYAYFARYCPEPHACRRVGLPK
jgi:hypothetical protein